MSDDYSIRGDVQHGCKYRMMIFRQFQLTERRAACIGSRVDAGVGGAMPVLAVCLLPPRESCLCVISVWVNVLLRRQVCITLNGLSEVL